MYAPTSGTWVYAPASGTWTGFFSYKDFGKTRWQQVLWPEGWLTHGQKGDLKSMYCQLWWEGYPSSKKNPNEKGERSKTVKFLQRGGLHSIGVLESPRRLLKEINVDNMLNSGLSSGSVHSHFDTQCRVPMPPLAKCTNEWIWPR